MKRVIITDYTFPNVAQEEQAAQIAGAEFAHFQCKTAEEVVAAVKDADVVAVQFAPFTKAAAQAVNQGATIIRYGIGYDNIEQASAYQLGLKLGYVPDYCPDEVAEHSAACILAMLRKLPMLDSSVRRGEWAAVKYAKPLKPLKDTLIGIFGMGAIGQGVVQKLKSFGCQFLGFDPFFDSRQAELLGVTMVSEKEFLSKSDVISIHAPANAQTIGFFNMQRFQQMQNHAMLVNPARGQLIVEDDLAQALHEGVIGGAALDVFHQEPLPANSALRDAPNLLLTPHVAWYSEMAIDRLQALVADDITRALQGKNPRKPIPKES